MNPTTQRKDEPESDVRQSALPPSSLPTPQSLETPPKSPQPATNSFQPTAVGFAEEESAWALHIGPGTNIDGYVLVKTIATTKMSVVFQARQPGSEQLVALKLIQQGAFADQESIDRFQQEIKTLGQMQPHKNIVPIYHVGRYRSELYYVMPYLADGSLAQQLPCFQADRRRSVTLIEKVARAVHQLHTRKPKILHRDIKPANILLASEDEPLLADFGLIKLLDDSQALTQTHKALGTPAYMAPEQTGLVPTPVSERTDIWALGVVLYEVLTGTRPFAKADDEDTSKLFWRIVHQEAPNPTMLKPDLDPGLAAVISKCLEKKPEDRYGNAEELAEELSRWLRGDAVTARSKVTGIRRHIRARPKLSSMLAAIFLLVPIGAVALWQVRQPDRPLRRLQEDLRRGNSVTLIGEKSMPVWWHPLRSDQARTSLGPDGYFTVQSSQTAMIELMREIPVESYRLRGRIRHETSELGGKVGVFFGYHSRVMDWGSYELYFQCCYNDVIRNNALTKPAKARPIKNYVRFSPVLNADFGDSKLENREFALDAVGHFDATLFTGKKWRSLSVTVQPQQLLLQFEDQPALTINLQQKTKEFRTDLNAWLDNDKNPDYVPLRSCEARFAHDGALGIIISGGAAAFDDFVLEPLNDERK